jgi:hypothetical protein
MLIGRSSRWLFDVPTIRTEASPVKGISIIFSSCISAEGVRSITAKPSSSFLGENRQNRRLGLKPSHKYWHDRDMRKSSK